ncbi:MAG: T9SS type A sorting domain-containing protein, partial [Bacteroidota bacterium]
DGGGNVSVTGASDGGPTFYDFCTIRYSSAGVRLWTARYSEPGFSDDRASAIAVDGYWSIFVTGSSYMGRGWQYLTIMYNFAGARFWTAVYAGIPAGVEREEPGIPRELRLLGNHPNPFNPLTDIAYTLPRRTAVRIAVSDVAGREVALLLEGTQESGRHLVSWNARGCASGVYFCTLETPAGISSIKMLLLR